MAISGNYVISINVFKFKILLYLIINLDLFSKLIFLNIKFSWKQYINIFEQVFNYSDTKISN